MKPKPRTKTQWAATLFLAAVLAPGARAQIVVTNITPLPLAAISETAASTLLVPYFEVDLANPNGRNTVFTVNVGGRLDTVSVNGNPPNPNNNAPTAVLAHVTIWSDLGVPVLNFNIYLTGFDVETVNMRNVLAGTLPRTASAGQDPSDQISPKGTRSQDINFASCNGPLPPAALSAPLISNLTSALTGVAAPVQCAGLNYNDHVARGYVTIDTVNNCTPRSPADPGYFPANNGDVTNQNNLTGEVYYLDPSNSIARGVDIVHVHSTQSGGDAIVTTSGNYTFYGRLNGFTATDQREPLSTSFSARFNPGGMTTSWKVPRPSAAAASLIVWRDPKVPQGYFNCGILPAWYPLGQENITVFDEQEHPQTLTGLTPFPAATQLVPIGGVRLPFSFTSGILWLDLNTTVTGAVGPASDLTAAQAWVQVIDGKYGVMHNAQQFDSATNPTHSHP